MCGDGTCLQKKHLCDGVPDCADGSDEVDCGSCMFLLFYIALKLTILEYNLCLSPNWFKCKNGKCISHALYCDESDDCGDWSDETYDCTYTHVV
jgi:Low-density lipoprotein receptor domain class A